MKKIQKKAFIFTFVLITSIFTVYAESQVDNIFENQKIEDGDFYNIISEPSKKEIEDENSKFFESVKQKKLNLLKNVEKKRQKLESSKKTLSSATEKARQELEKNKSNLKTKPSKKENQTKTEQKSEKTKTDSLKKNTTVQNKQKENKSAKTAQEKTDIQKEQQNQSEKNTTIEISEQKIDSIINLRKKFIDIGMDFKGTEYVWGGKTPRPGFDCSGLISYTAKQSLGIDIRGNAQDIYDQTSPIPLDEALPGDLIFFKGSTDSRITHVGIYLGKNPGENDFGTQNLFLNAASSGPRTGVIISGLNENYWKKTFYACGRIIPEF